MGPDDIELGDELIEIERRPRAGLVISVRLSAEEADQLERVAERDGTTLTRAARAAILASLGRWSS